MDFLQTKWKLWFHALDVNHDGKLSDEDLQDLTETFIKLHEEFDDAQRNETKKRLESWWNKYISRGRTDGISAEVFVEGMAKEYRTDKDKFIEEYTNCQKEIANIIDTNNDQYISGEEYLAAYKAFGHTNVGLDMKLFQAFNPENGVYPVTKNVEFWVHFLTCNDKSKPDVIKAALEGGL